MTVRAALVPYYRGRALVLVAGPGGVIAERTLDVGRTLCHAHAAEDCAACLAAQGANLSRPVKERPILFRREVTPEDAAAVARVVADVCAHNGVTSLLVEEGMAGEWGARAAMVTDAVRAAGCMPEMRPTGSGDARARALAMLGMGEPTARRLPRGVVEVGAQKDEGPGGEPSSPANGAAAPGDPVTATASPQPTPALVLAQGARVVGVDPGERWVSAIVGEVAGRGVRYVDHCTWAFGREVPRDPPKVVKREDGSTYTLTTRYVYTDADVEALLEVLFDFLAAHRVEAAAVEHAKNFRPCGDIVRDGARSAKLLRSQDVGGEIAGALRVWLAACGEGVRVRRVVSKEWRDVVARRWKDEGPSRLSFPGPSLGPSALVPPTRLTGSEPHRSETRMPQPTPDPPVAQVLAGRTPEPWAVAVRALLPAPEGVALDEHAVDAAGCLLWAAMPEDAPATPKPPRAPRKPGEKRQTAQSARVSAERKARREAAGCTCSGRRDHAKDCPCYVPREGGPMVCSVCGQTGHNRRNKVVCPGPPNSPGSPDVSA